MFSSLSALVYQHTVTPLALPALLVLPSFDLMPGQGGADEKDSKGMQLQQLLNLGAACNVLYLFTMDTDSLTGPSALAKTVAQLFSLAENNAAPASAMATCVHFKASCVWFHKTDSRRNVK